MTEQINQSGLHFSFAEFFNSDYAKRLGVNNVTSDSKILTTIMTTIVCLLEPIRTLCNKYDLDTTDKTLDPTKTYKLKQLTTALSVGITLTGGFRSADLIKKCKEKLGVIMSSTGHPDGECADITRSPWSNLKLFCVIKALHKAGYLNFDQLIYEYDTNCCHVGFRKNGNRNQIMTRKLVNGKLTYYNV